MALFMEAGMASEVSERRHVVLVFIIVLFEFISAGAANPILPRVIGDLNRTSIPTAAYVFAIFLIADIVQFFWAPALGTLSDRIGRRKILVLSTIGLSVGSITRFFADHIAIFLLVSAVLGFVSATLPAAMSSAADVVSKERRTAVFGLITGAAVSGYVIGPIIGGFVSDIDIRLPFLIAAIFGVADLVLVLVLLKETLPPAKRQNKSIGLKSLPFAAIARQPRQIKMLLALFFSSHFVMSMPHTFVVIYLIDRFSWKGSTIGLGLSMHMLVASLGQLVISGQLSRRWGELNVTLLSILCGALFLIVLGVANNTMLILASYALFGTIAIAIPACASLISASTPPEGQGEIQGILASMMGLARMVLFGCLGPIFAFMSDRSASPAVGGMLFVAVGAVLVVGLVWIRLKVHPQVGEV